MNARFFVLLAALGLSLTAAAQGVLGRRTLGNLDIETITQNDIQVMRSRLASKSVNDARAAEIIKKEAVSDEDFKKLRSRLPSSVLMDSMNVMSYVKRSIFRDTLIFGSELFNDETKLDFAPNLQIAYSPNYMLGPGDELELTIYGLQSANYVLKVRPDGNVEIPYAGLVQASGMRIAGLEAKIRQKLIDRGYRPLQNGQTELNLVLSKVRSIQVHVVGAKEPGTYTVPSVATALHVLHEAGGPGELGTYRAIEVIRDGKVLSTLDIYEFIVTGSTESNVALRDGDVIRIPVYQRRVNMMGEFKRPGLFELRDGETMNDALTYAGGFTEGGYRGQVLIFRVGEQELRVADVSADQYGSFKPDQGDVVIANPIRNRYANRVSITGGVVRPGYYAWTEGQTALDLINRAQGLDRNALTTKALLVRRPDGAQGTYEEFNPTAGGASLSLQRNDSLYIPLNTDLMAYDSVHVRGFVNHPKNFVYFAGLTVEQAILMAGGVRSTGDLTNVEVSFPERTAEGTFTGIAKINRVTLNWTGTGTLLPPGATVSVRQRSNMNTSKVVYVTGAVSTPGGYSLQSNGEPVGGVVQRIGAFDEDGLPQFAMVVRNRGYIEELDDKNMEPRLLDDSTYVMQATKKKIRQADTVAVDLTSRWALNHFRVQDGDTLVVPRRINTVFVKGAVQNQAGLSVQPGRRAKYYLRAAGGVAPEGIRRSLVVEYANGRSATMRYFMGVVPVYPRVYSNSTIHIDARDPDARRNDPAQMAAISSIIGSTSSLAMTLFFLLR
jgi:protein involved in polysaccharide export with SLBB domain